MARRIRVRSSAGAGVAPALFFEARQDEAVDRRPGPGLVRTAGTGTALTGWNDQNRRLCFGQAGPRFPRRSRPESPLSSGQGRPSATQRERTSISRSLSFSLGGILGSCS